MLFFNLKIIFKNKFKKTWPNGSLIFYLFEFFNGRLQKNKKSTFKLELKLGWINGISGERWENFNYAYFDKYNIRYDKEEILYFITCLVIDGIR